MINYLMPIHSIIAELTQIGMEGCPIYWHKIFHMSKPHPYIKQVPIKYSSSQTLVCEKVDNDILNIK